MGTTPTNSTGTTPASSQGAQFSTESVPGPAERAEQLLSQLQSNPTAEERARIAISLAECALDAEPDQDRILKEALPKLICMVVSPLEAEPVRISAMASLIALSATQTARGDIASINNSLLTELTLRLGAGREDVVEACRTLLFSKDRLERHLALESLVDPAEKGLNSFELVKHRLERERNPDHEAQRVACGIIPALALAAVLESEPELVDSLLTDLLGRQVRAAHHFDVVLTAMGSILARHHDETVRLALRDLLGEVEHPEAQAIIEYIDQSASAVSAPTAIPQPYSHEDFIVTTCTTLADRTLQPYKRASALLGLSKEHLNDHRLLGALTDCLSDEEPVVRALAMRNLASGVRYVAVLEDEKLAEIEQAMVQFIGKVIPMSAPLSSADAAVTATVDEGESWEEVRAAIILLDAVSLDNALVLRSIDAFHQAYKFNKTINFYGLPALQRIEERRRQTA